MSTLQTTQLNIPEGMIDFGVGQPSLSLLPLAALRQAAEHRLSQGDSSLLQYGAEQGDGYFRFRLAQFLAQRYDLPVEADHLLVTSGASQALDLICTRFTQPGDTIFVEEPTYFLALLIFRDYRLNIVGIPMDENGLVIEALEEKLTQHRPVFLYTIPAFHNPSAVTLSAERRERLVSLSQEHGFLVVADEVYQMLDYTVKPPPPLAISPRNRAPLPRSSSIERSRSSVATWKRFHPPGRGSPPALPALPAPGTLRNSVRPSRSSAANCGAASMLTMKPSTSR